MESPHGPPIRHNIHSQYLVSYVLLGRSFNIIGQPLELCKRQPGCATVQTNQVTASYALVLILLVRMKYNILR